MNKHQIACQAVLAWDEVAEDAKLRMLATLKQNKLAVVSDEKGRTAEILGKKFGVSGKYVKEARKLYLSDREAFEQVLNGEAQLPVVRPKGKEKGNVSYSLYRAYNAEGKLLYIGKTWSVGQRMKGHAGGSEWWDEFTTMTVDRNFDTYEDLSKAETLAISNEQPIYNKLGAWYQ